MILQFTSLIILNQSLFLTCTLFILGPITTDTNDSTRSKGSHLTIDDRIKISVLKELEYSNRMIAQYIGVAHGTIDREIKRGMVTKMSKQSNNGKVYRYYKEYYDLYTAQERYEKSRSNCGRTPIYQSSPEIIDLLDDLMLGEFDFKDHDKFESLDSQKCSPYAALKIAETLVGDDVKLPASERSIYNWIDKGLLRTKNIDLLEKTRRSKAKHGRTPKREQPGKNISQRPEEVDTRSTFGHWEMDTVQGKKSAEDPVILVLAERLTRYNLAFKIASKTPNAVSRVIMKLKELAGDHFMVVSSLRSLVKLTKYTMPMPTRHGNVEPTRTTIGSFVEVSLKVPVYSCSVNLTLNKQT